MHDAGPENSMASAALEGDRNTRQMRLFVVLSQGRSLFVDLPGWATHSLDHGVKAEPRELRYGRADLQNGTTGSATWQRMPNRPRVSKLTPDPDWTRFKSPVAPSPHEKPVWIRVW